MMYSRADRRVQTQSAKAAREATARAAVIALDAQLSPKPIEDKDDPSASEAP